MNMVRLEVPYLVLSGWPVFSINVLVRKGVSMSFGPMHGFGLVYRVAD
jgi:hypothetical protein